MTGWADVPFTTRFRVVDGLTVRFVESDEARGVHALLLSPWPESLLAFAPMWGWLADHAHLVALDLPGFGRSQRAEALMSPSEMAGFIVRAARAFGLEQPHVLGPGIGAPSALFAAALYPDRLSSLVVGGGASALPLQLGRLLSKWIAAPDADLFQEADPRTILAGNRREMPPEHVLDEYVQCYQGSRFVESMRYVRTYPRQIPLLADLLPHVRVPVQIIAGTRDELVPPTNATYLHQALPSSRLDFLDTGHFAWEDAADQYAEIVTDWWRGRYAAHMPAQEGT